VVNRGAFPVQLTHWELIPVRRPAPELFNCLDCLATDCAGVDHRGKSWEPEPVSSNVSRGAHFTGAWHKHRKGKTMDLTVISLFISVVGLILWLLHADRRIKNLEAAVTHLMATEDSER